MISEKKTDSKRFCFIFNRFKCKSLGSTYASQVHEEVGDFEVFYDDFGQLKMLLKEKLEVLFTKNETKLNFYQKEKEREMWSSLENVSDLATMETFIVSLINYSGIVLKGFAKVFYDQYEYFYNDFKILRFKANERTFLHNLTKEHDVVWERALEPARSHSYQHKSFLWKDNQNMKITADIKTEKDFYDHYINHKIDK